MTFKEAYKRVERYGIFFIVFNICFAILVFSLNYAIPFVLSAFMALLLYPISRVLYNKTKINRDLINIFCILLTFAIMISFLTLIGYGIFSEAKDLVIKVSILNIDVESIFEKFNSIKENTKLLPPDVINIINNQIEMMINKVGVVSATLVNNIIKLIASIPMGLINILITIIATFLLLKDFDYIKRKFLKSEMNKRNSIPLTLFKRANEFLAKYIQSYTIIWTMTFIEGLIVFKILGIKYCFTLAIIAMIADILPIIGVGFVFTPISAIYFLMGDYVRGIIVIICYIIITVIRQIVEPKLLAASLKIHPLVILVCIYVGMRSFGIMGMIYLLSFVVFFKILREINAI